MDTRERYVEAAIDLLREGGYARAGINEIVAGSGAPKGSLYHHFPGGKQQIVQESLAAYTRAVTGYVEQALARGRTPGEKVRALFAAVARRLEQSGYRRSCAAGAVALDLDADLEPVRDAVRAFFDTWVALVAAEIAPGADAPRRQALAGLLLTAIEGGYVRGRAEHSTRALDEAGEWLGVLADQVAAGARAAPTPRRARR